MDSFLKENQSSSSIFTADRLIEEGSFLSYDFESIMENLEKRLRIIERELGMPLYLNSDSVNGFNSWLYNPDPSAPSSSLGMKMNLLEIRLRFLEQRPDHLIKKVRVSPNGRKNTEPQVAQI